MKSKSNLHLDNTSQIEIKGTNSSEKLATGNSFPIVAIGSSAGGLEAARVLFQNLPPQTGMAFIYVQHLSPDYESALTEILAKTTKMEVQEIHDMDKIQPDHIYVIPNDKGVEVTEGRLILIPRSKNSSAITINVLFSSLALAQKGRVIGIVLSGSASDGTEGLKAIKHEGGITFAQDDSALFKNMPQSAIKAGVVDFVMSPDQIAQELIHIGQHPLVTNKQLGGTLDKAISHDDPDLKIILKHLLTFTKVDFQSYKMSTVKRRILRRMLTHKIITLKEYARYLTDNSQEIGLLYQDLLINVTSFFREPNTYTYLKSTLLPKLLKSKSKADPLRI